MEAETYRLVKHKVKELLDVNLDAYKDEQVRRRLDSWLVRSGALDWQAYFQRLGNDLAERERFRNYLTINVSAFFRDPERWQALRQQVLPNLMQSALRLKPPRSRLRIWSAGCSIGAEAYTLVILLDEITFGGRHFILASDVDRGALNKARDGGPYTPEEVQNLSTAQRLNYLQPGGPPFYVQPSLRRRVEFIEHDLLSDPPPEDLDLIVCRNVVIYFTAEAKGALYRKFYQALRPGGVLFLGATEVIPRSHELGFRYFGLSFYQKVEAF